MRTLPVLLLLAACPAEPTWMEHPCGRGDPVEFTCEDEDHVVLEEPSTTLCSELGVEGGDPCETVEERCVLLQATTCASEPGPRNSEASLHCRRDAWEPEDELCPQSSRAVKRDIVYVDAAERRTLSEQVLQVKLARYDYVDPAKPGRKLGYILEDSPEAAFSGEGRVDLYAYLSALVATTQEQERRIQALEAEIRALRAGDGASVTAPSD